MTNENDPRLRQDKVERKDKENSNAGMIAGVIIVIVGIVGIFLYYNYEVAPTQATTVTQPAPNNAPSPTNPNNNPPTNNNVPTNTTTQSVPQS